MSSSHRCSLALKQKKNPKTKKKTLGSPSFGQGFRVACSCVWWESLHGAWRTQCSFFFGVPPTPALCPAGLPPQYCSLRETVATTAPQRGGQAWSAAGTPESSQTCRRQRILFFAALGVAGNLCNAMQHSAMRRREMRSDTMRTMQTAPKCKATQCCALVFAYSHSRRLISHAAPLPPARTTSTGSSSAKAAAQTAPLLMPTATSGLGGAA